MIDVLVAGLGNMGKSHALAYHKNPGFNVVGLVNRSDVELVPELAGYPRYDDFHSALEKTKPGLVCIATYTDTHANYAIDAMATGAHVFVEKPLAATLEDAERVVAYAQQTGRKLVVGYILRHHPSWKKLIENARDLGGPFVFRLNLNQQSHGAMWATQSKLMQTTSPIVDCGVHYVDVMCQITDAAPTEVRGMGVRLTEEIPTEMYNYGQFQVLFDDGSAGWYEAGWGPMISETAHFVKDVISPNGAVSIAGERELKSDDIDGHTAVGAIRTHFAQTNPDGSFANEDRLETIEGEPGHQELCDFEQEFVRRAIVDDIDLSKHTHAAVVSLEICLAADESVRTGNPVKLVRR